MMALLSQFPRTYCPLLHMADRNIAGHHTQPYVQVCDVHRIPYASQEHKASNGMVADRGTSLTSVRSMVARAGAPAILWSRREAAGAFRGGFGSAPVLGAELARPNLAGVASWKAERAALCARRSVGAAVGDAKSGKTGPPCLSQPLPGPSFGRFLKSLIPYEASLYTAISNLPCDKIS